LSEALQPTKRVRALLTDVDGCLTDGGMYFDAQGQALKRFDVKDGFIVRPLQDAGVLWIWITGDDSAITRARAARLGIDEVRSGVEDKGQAVREVLEQRDLGRDEVVYLGDDLNDLPAMAEAGLAACPADAVPQVLAAADLVLTRAGGHGAARELADLIMAWNAELG
jgi:3-deoxy-D-manno-octulosonate 8-phosphate phosphatase (KDO 8-P phosphatase)